MSRILIATLGRDVITGPFDSESRVGGGTAEQGKYVFHFFLFEQEQRSAAKNKKKKKNTDK